MTDTNSSIPIPDRLLTVDEVAKIVGVSFLCPHF